MRRLGLALSGGGFRATLFHLGLVRFLRDAGILPDVTHITSVSGGSIIAAHMAVNWDRYCGSAEQFDTAASELLDYVQLDVRNQIVRRYPFTIPVRMLRRLLRRDTDRWLTRTGLLESYYRRHLFGETSLFELPERPQLHMLATNLSEGGLCSFTQQGLILQRRTSPTSFRFDHVQADLATVAMGVAASSAFPGFFPPLQLSSSDLGASQGDFSRQSFTDGGVFDNLGIRMFRFIERAWIGREAGLQSEDFLDLETALQSVNRSLNAGEEHLGGRFGSLLASACANRTQFEDANQLLECLSKLMRDEQLYRNPAFDGLQLPLSDAQSLLEHARKSDEQLDRNDHCWLNRQVLGETLQLMTGKACLRPFGAGLDGILVSDAGRPFQTVTNSHHTSMIATSMRASDILMDRVGQLERETFQDAPGLVFAATFHEVSEDEDRTVMPLAVQRRIPTIRTDLDRFSPVEISSLLRHGYCVGRKTCRHNPALFGDELPDGPPWDPLDAGESARPATVTSRTRPGATSVATGQARTLHASSARRIWSTMWDYRDWVSYLYIPILLPILLFGPYVGYRMYRQSQLISSVTSSLQNAGPFLIKAFDLLESGPVAALDSMAMEEVPQLDPETLEGVEAWQDGWIIDLRRSDMVYKYRRVQVVRSRDVERPALVRLNGPAEGAGFRIRSPNSELHPRISRETPAQGAATDNFTWQIEFDLSRVPPGEPADIVVETQRLRELPAELPPMVEFEVTGSPGILTLFVLLPADRPYGDFWVLRTDPDQPGLVEKIVPSSRGRREDGSVIMIQIIEPEPGSVYECHWTWLNDSSP